MGLGLFDRLPGHDSSEPYRLRDGAWRIQSWPAVAAYPSLKTRWINSITEPSRPAILPSVWGAEGDSLRVQPLRPHRGGHHALD